MGTADLAIADAPFDRAYPWVVNSVRQSRLLESWLQQFKDMGTLPALADFAALHAYREQSELTVYDVINANGSLRYFVVQEGAAFKAFYGSSGKDRFLDEVMSPRAWQLGHANLDECVRQALPVYMAVSIRDGDGQKFIYERLLLPFGSSASEVTGMVASLKTTSWAGARDMHLMRLNGHDLEYSFRSIIALG